MVQVTIDGVDKTNLIQFGLNSSDQINSGADIANFLIKEYGSQTFRPEVNQEVIINIDGVRRYGGVIVEVEQSLDGHTTIVHAVKCLDFGQYLNRLLVVERYQNTTLQAIIFDLIYRYANDYGFTTDSVQGADIAVKSVSFSEITLSDCLNKLAKLTGYYWYVDFYKDLHFFKRNDESAPFNLTDESANYIYDSLVVKDDFSQIRNSVKVTGGEAVSNSRTEKLAGDGERDTFPLGNKFSEVPTVAIAGVSKTVGVDFIQKDEDYDVMWSFQQKYLRFTSGNTPPKPVSPATTNIDVTGTPLKPIVIKRLHAPSISQYGLYEHAVKNDSIKSRDEALQFALTDLQSYSDKIRGGSFDTNEGGLRSGQTISITSERRGISETFLIQSVRFTMMTPEVYKWHVEVATTKTISMIDLLQNMLIQERISVGEDETLLNFIEFSDGFSLTDVIGDPVTTTSEDYVIEQDDPGSDSYPNPAIVNKCTISS